MSIETPVLLADSEDAFFLPDFCRGQMVFGVVVVGELFAFVLVLSPLIRDPEWWRDLALTSLFVQWVGLTSAGMLCVTRRWLSRLPSWVAGVVSYAIILFVTLALSEAAYWWVARPMEFLLSPEAAVNAWRFDGAFPMGPSWHLDFLVRNLVLSAILSAVTLHYFYVQHQWRRQVESEAKARVQALQSRIRPHFLFNSMNTIASLTRTSPLLAEQVTEDLADLFRASLSDASVPVVLGRELEICQQYLRIEEHRLGERVSTRLDLNHLPLDALLPGLTLQPLAENAIYHGIEPAPDGGEVHISGQRRNGIIELSISNSFVPGFVSDRKGSGMAQENVHFRLRAFFGKDAGLFVEPAQGRYLVRVRFPYRVAS